MSWGCVRGGGGELLVPRANGGQDGHESGRDLVPASSPAATRPDRARVVREHTHDAEDRESFSAYIQGSKPALRIDGW
jgi:hypothetical protein